MCTQKRLKAQRLDRKWLRDAAGPQPRPRFCHEPSVRRSDLAFLLPWTDDVDFVIAINGLFEEPAAEAADALTNAPNLETVMKCKLGMLRTQPLISLGN